jgi:hypothetical protein
MSPDFKIVEFPDGSPGVFPACEADENKSSVASGKVQHDPELEDGPDPLENGNELGLRHISGNFPDEHFAALRRLGATPITRRTEMFIFEN